MTRNKKPAMIVAIVLAGLIVLPLFFLMFSRSGGDAAGEQSDRSGSTVNGSGAVVDFNLRQLADKANSLIENDLAAALRNGDITLDFMADLKRDGDKASSALKKGKLDQATDLYNKVISKAEAQLEALKLADKARALSASIYKDLQRLEYLKPAFENSYREAVETYNSGLRALNSSDYQLSVDDFEMAGAVLGDMEARAIAQIATLLEVANDALEKYELSVARTTYQAVLELDAAQAEATSGLVMVTALEGIAEEVKYIRSLEARGELEAALSELTRLAADNPQNPFITNQLTSLQERILERDFRRLVDESIAFEAAGDIKAAIDSLESGLKLKPDVEQQARLALLKEMFKAQRLEQLLADGFASLKAGRFEAARDLYREAVALAPESKEARNGLEKSSSLYLANIRYSQNMAAAAKYLEEGRFPLAAKLFNQAMSSRPSNVIPAQEAAEESIRETLKEQSAEVTVDIRSDKRTYVSIIGVLPPERFKAKDLNLYPDVYKIRGTRSGYEPVEIEFKVDATKPNPTISVECTDKL